MSIDKIENKITIEMLEHMVIRKQHLGEDAVKEILKRCVKTFGPMGLHTKDSQNNNLLQLAIKHNCCQLIPFLIEQKVDINNLNTIEKITILDYMAIHKRHLYRFSTEEIVAVCEEAFGPMGLHTKDAQNNSLLQLAIKHNCYEFIRFLIEHKVDINHLNNDEETALSIALQHGFMFHEIVLMLCEKRTIIEKPFRVNDIVLKSKEDILSFLLFDAIQCGDQEKIVEIINCSKKQIELEQDPTFKLRVINRLNDHGLSPIETITENQRAKCAMFNTLLGEGASCGSLKYFINHRAGTFDPRFFNRDEREARTGINAVDNKHRIHRF